MSVVVFVGPTLGQRAISEILQAEILPPVRQGDVYRVARENPRAIGIIDGYFEGVPSVWHKEILWAMEQDIPVFGSASMGALRAAELADFGMIGVGRIFEDYYAGVLEDDDEVAVLHSPAELGFQPLSEPMVSIRATVARALECGVLSPGSAEAILRAGKALHYRDRDWPSLLSMLAQDHDLDAFSNWLPEGKVDAKREDACDMLRQMAAYLEGGAESPETPTRVERTLAWQGLTRRIDGETARDRSSAQDLLDELRLDPARFADLRERAMLGVLAQEDAARRGLQADREALMAQMDRHRAQAGLAQRRDILHWLEANDLDESGYEDFLGSAALTDEIRALRADRLEPHMLSAMRWAGNYTDLKARAQAKKAALRGVENGAFAGHDRLRLLIWYFEERLRQPVPEDLDEHAQTLGLADREEFCTLVAREFLYSQGGGDAAEAPDA
ncbi:TfuA-like protein [Ruegeria sp. 2205SS24-7]|uniref:TfuA-like protein n=1 Tax=Ruegeria discodermiae TaxID=3064389 RepID=UPI00274044DA|nr:TfuA-like protein [Ruegeria sp. 2205SS24-7]MDP5217179.1 TfuA-like protein [Ruegeria sp. 2205SS24-7]